MTRLRLRVRVGRWLARDMDGVDLGDCDDANELLDLACERLREWAEGELDPEDFTTGYDVGTVCAFISDGIKITTRSALLDAITRISQDPDLGPLAAVRLAELQTYYFDDRLELPAVDYDV